MIRCQFRLKTIPVLLGLCWLLISPCVLSLQELGAITSLQPMMGPDHRTVGWEWHFVDEDGETGMMQKTDGTPDNASYTRSDGCIWTRLVYGFAPASVWENCPSTGKAVVSLTSGKIWPLVVGNKFVYEIKGSSSLFSKVWKSRRKCEVVNQVRIKTIAGEFDTFKLHCKERWGTRTWWLSPSLGTAVAYQQKTIRGGLVRQEMTKIVRP